MSLTGMQVVTFVTINYKSVGLLNAAPGVFQSDMNKFSLSFSQNSQVEFIVMLCMFKPQADLVV